MVLPIKPTMEMLNLKRIKENATTTENIKDFIMEYMSEYGLQGHLKSRRLLGSHRGVAVLFTDHIQMGWGIF